MKSVSSSSPYHQAYRRPGVPHSDWCRYKMKGSNRTLVKLHYDMVIDERTFKDGFRKDFKHKSVSCETHSVVSQTANRRRRIASKIEANRWPLEIPYQIDKGFDFKAILTIRTAMDHWNRHTCLHFVERTDQYDHIRFSPDIGRCESFVGRLTGPQYISLDPQICMTVPIILHEIGHAIGLYHEHMREDRDNYLTVNYKNISQEYYDQFITLSADQYLDFNKPYDYHSIMHYGKRFFANPSDAISIEPTDKTYLDIIGEAQHLSFHDVQIVNAMYKCSEKCANVECPKGAFVGKNCECFCQGPLKEPVRRCNDEMPSVFCEAPDIDLSKNGVYSIEYVELKVLSGIRYRDGTVLIVENPRCSENETGTYTCQSGHWVVDVNCKPDRCVYNTSRYDFKPNITANGKYQTTDYVNSGTFVHAECIEPKGIQGYDSTCTDSIWVPELPNCDADVRAELVDGPNKYSGRVEIIIGKHRGTVCDDTWDNKDASVICRMLGYGGGTAFIKAHFGQGSSSILFDDVQCNGTETSITSCRHSGVENHNCEHSEDAGVKCIPKCGKHQSTGQYPWEVRVQIQREKAVSICGGTIIDQRWILSTAHCFADNETLGAVTGVIVHVGSQDLFRHLRPDQIIFHPSFNSTSYDYDLALLLMNDKIVNEEVQPACLPDESIPYNLTGLRCHVSGWAFDQGIATVPLGADAANIEAALCVNFDKCAAELEHGVNDSELVWLRLKDRATYISGSATKTVELDCDVRGNPEPNITWYKVDRGKRALLDLTRSKLSERVVVG
ncbi:uncharacterized protein LOC127839660 [Dreissena polymorpha]|uniref:uncharacterized protein LOC127839660 n=1 Tax=Dreissena polymorpha TaxID=45954 RepID=UPI002263C608|nr:uncharacterized protein LOC127839660 [Dreissena polymorpha]